MIVLGLKNRKTGEIKTFDYEINILSHVVKLMVDDIMDTVKSNDPYNVWLEWDHVPLIDTWWLNINIEDKKADTHFGYMLSLYGLDDPMCELEHILFSIVNDSDIDYLNKDNFKMEVTC